MATRQAPAWRRNLTDACALVARAASDSPVGTADTVVRMLSDSGLRTELCDVALQRNRPVDGDPSSTAEYQRLQRAVDLLRGYEGRTL